MVPVSSLDSASQHILRTSLCSASFRFIILSSGRPSWRKSCVQVYDNISVRAPFDQGRQLCCAWLQLLCPKLRRQQVTARGKAALSKNRLENIDIDILRPLLKKSKVANFCLWWRTTTLNAWNHYRLPKQTALSCSFLLRAIGDKL